MFQLGDSTLSRHVDSGKQTQACHSLIGDPKPLSRMVPSVAFMVDGVLAKRYQFVLDLLCLRGYDGYHGVADADQLTEPVRLQDDVLQRIKSDFRRTEDSWYNLDAYQDVDFDDLNTKMSGGDFLGHFMAVRFPLESEEVRGRDHQFLTRLWLDKRCYRPLQAHSINADLRPKEVVQWLSLIRADYFLTDSINDALDALSAGVDAYLIDRSYNRNYQLPFRVQSISEFLSKTVYS